MPLAEVNGVRADAAGILSRFPGATVSTKFGETYVCVAVDQLVDVINYIKNDPELKYDYFAECVGVDYSTYSSPRDFDKRFEVVYNLMSVTHATRLFIKVAVNVGESIPTLKNIYLGAEYPEREITDLLGVVFEGNENVGRFLLPDDWVGFPLRKEVPLGGEDVVFHEAMTGPAVEDVAMPHAGESFEGNTGTKPISGR